MIQAKHLLMTAAASLLFAGCATTNPEAAFDDVDNAVSARTGHDLRWLRDDSQHKKVVEAVDALLRTNLVAPSAVTIALLNNRSLQAEFEEVGISQADLAQASRLHNIEIVGSWRIPDRPPSVVDAEYSAAGDFLDLLTLPARKKLARHQLEQTKLHVADRVLRLAADTQAAFYTLQADEALAKRLGVIEQVNEAAADLAQRQYDAGNINELELRNQQAAQAQSRLDLAQSQAQARADRERLNRILGLSGGMIEWKLADELPPLPEKESRLENLETLAVSRRLDLAAARGQAELVAAALRLKRSTRYLPAVTVGVSAERGTDRQTITGPNLALELPLFDQGQPAIARLVAQYRQAERNQEALETNVRSEVRQAREALLAARAAAESYDQTLLPLRRRILKETLLHYNAMQKSSYELLAAKEREQTAERGSIEALRDYWIARAELEKAVGGNLGGETSAREKMSSEQSKSGLQHENHK